MAYGAIDPNKLTPEQRVLWDEYEMAGPLGPNVTRGFAEAQFRYICTLEGCPIEHDVDAMIPGTATKLRWTHWIPANIYGRLVEDGRRHHAEGVEALSRGDSISARSYFAASVAASDEAAAFALAHARENVATLTSTAGASNRSPR